MKKIRQACLAFAVVLVLMPCGAAMAADEPRTFDRLTPEELDRISKLTLSYYMCVSDKLPAVRGADNSTPERIFATYPPHILIFRQQCRISLINLEKELYALRLNPEFITNHVNTLRDDVVHFALQRTLKRAEEERGEADWRKGAEPAANAPAETQNSSARKGNLGMIGNILSAPAKREQGQDE